MLVTLSGMVTLVNIEQFWIISLSMAHMSELVVIIAALAALALYVALLFLLRRHISSRFVLSVQKQQKSDTPLC